MAEGLSVEVVPRTEAVQEAETITTVRRLREWRRFVVETLVGTGLLVLFVVERLRPGAQHIIPDAYCYHAAGAGLAILTGFGGDVVMAIAAKVSGK